MVIHLWDSTLIHIKNWIHVSFLSKNLNKTGIRPVPSLKDDSVCKPDNTDNPALQDESNRAGMERYLNVLAALIVIFFI